MKLGCLIRRLRWWSLPVTIHAAIFKFKSSYSQVFFKISVLQIFEIFTRKHPCWSGFSIKLKVACLKVCSFIKKRPRYRCFPVNIAKFLKPDFFIKHLRRLLLQVYQYTIIKIPVDAIGVVLVSLLLTLNIFHTLF